MEKVKKLKVKYNDIIVGYLAELDNGQIAFQYDEFWIKNGFSISPFSLPLSDKIYINQKNNFDGLYGVFWDSLPDGWGELIIKRMLAKKGINYDNLSPLQKLSLISSNGLGALTYEPSETDNNSTCDIDLDTLANDARKILNNEATNVELDQIYRLGGSSGGARPKAHITIDDEEWIIKFPCLIDPINIGEKEYNANIIAKQCGININECRLFPSKLCSGYFGSKRFDRICNKKVHMISLSALLETSHRVPNLDYCHLLQVIQNICPNKSDMYEAYRRMCYNVMYHNKDDHGKNFSFIYDEKINGYMLSPAYDLTSTPDKPEHEMSIMGNGNPTETDLVAIAKEFRLSEAKCKKIIEEIKNIVN